MERVREEFMDLNKNPVSNCGITVGLSNENDYSSWKLTISGPNDTSYKGGLFFIKVKFPNDYPLKPPEINFITPIYHLNVNPRAPRSSEDLPLGYISLSCLSWWKPEYKIRDVLVSVFALFYKANPESPFGLDRAEEFTENRAVYEEKVKQFTKKYAGPLMGSKVYKETEDWDFEIINLF